MTKILQIKVGKHQTGIIGLDEVLKEIAMEDRNLDDRTIGAAMSSSALVINCKAKTVGSISKARLKDCFRQAQVQLNKQP